MTPQELIAVFEDTQRLIYSNPVLRERMQRCRDGSRLYPEGFVSPTRPRKAGAVEVVAATTFQCAGELYHRFGRTAVLNFANPQEPGGGVRRGAMAQEECLCRCSDLYAALDQPYFREHYYGFHYQRYDTLFTDRLIYSPGVTVIKSEHMPPRILEVPFCVDVITCAAPYLLGKAGKTQSELMDIYRSRIRNILEAAMSREVDCLILGAFGCGAFGNDPRLMARAFADLLYGERYAAHFEKVVFAIKASYGYSRNLEAFREVFGG